MALIDAKPLIDERSGQPIAGWTLLVSDTAGDMPVEDPDGEFLQRGQASLAAMRGSGAIGADRRAAQTDSPGVTQPLPFGNVVDRVGQAVADWRNSPPLEAGGNAPQAPPAPATQPAAAPPAATAAIAAPPSAPGQEGSRLAVVPGSKGGWRDTLRSTVGPDVSPETLKAIEDRLAPEFDAYAGANAAAGKAATDQNAARQERLANESSDNKLALQSKNDTLAKAEGDARTAAGDVRRWSEEKVDPGRRWGSLAFSISAGIGGFASQMLDIKAQRRGGKSNFAGDFWKSIWGMVQDDINEQGREISAAMSEAQQRFGSAAAAKSAVEAQIAKYTADQLAVNRQLAQTQEEAMDYDAALQLANAQLKTSMREAVTQYLPQVTAQQKYAAPTAATVVMLPSVSSQEREAAIAADFPEGLKPNQKLEQYEKLRKDYGENGAVLARVETVRKLVSEYKDGDVAGLGPLAKYIPTEVASQGAQAVRQSLGVAISAYLKEVSGAAVTEQEFKRLEEQVKGDGSTDSVLRGLSLISAPAQQRLESLAGSYPTIYQTFRGASQRGASAQRGGPAPKGKR